MKAEFQRKKIRVALQSAMLLDPGLQPLVDKLGYPEPRTQAPGFVTMLRIIVSQQLSTTAAATIWQRLENQCGGIITHRKILDCPDDQLRQCGLSAQKVSYARDLASRWSSPNSNFETLDSVDTEDAITKLISIRGIGRWSAEIYLMFALGREDIFPSGDLALRVAVQRYANLSTRPSAAETARQAAKWSPCRSVVALLMWRYYGATTLD